MLRLIVLLEIKSYCNTRSLWHEGLYSMLPQDRAHFCLHCGGDDPWKVTNPEYAICSESDCAL